MADFISIKRPPNNGMAPIYKPVEDECYDHCVTLNDEDLTKLDCPMPERGDLVHLNVMGKVVGVGDDHGHRYVRVEIEDVLFVENETEEAEAGEGEK
jgi:hypothetical protein